MNKVFAASIAAIGATTFTPTLHACFVPATTQGDSKPPVTLEVAKPVESQPQQELKGLVSEISQAIETRLTPPDIEATFSMSDSIILILAIALMLVVGGFSYTFLAVKKED